MHIGTLAEMSAIELIEAYPRGEPVTDTLRVPLHFDFLRGFVVKVVPAGSSVDHSVNADLSVSSGCASEAEWFHFRNPLESDKPFGWK